MLSWEIEYPRLVLAELNTHRQLSKNSFSSRAVPFMKMIEQLDGEPVRFGANQPGMQDKGEDYVASVIFGEYKLKPKDAWWKAKQMMISVSRAFYDAGYHKQVYNRLLESFQVMKTVLSATEVDNFFWLRDDDAADPTLRELARVMKEAWEVSTPDLLAPGEWHLPYLNWVRDDATDKQIFYLRNVDLSIVELSLYDAIKVSCARCAAVSYRNEDYDLAKSLEVYDRLVGSVRKHASAFEHQATPMQKSCVEMTGDYYPDTWEAGISHMDHQGNFWSGNLMGWVQYRKLIPNECYSKPNI